MATPRALRDGRRSTRVIGWRPAGTDPAGRRRLLLGAFPAVFVLPNPAPATSPLTTVPGREWPVRGVPGMAYGLSVGPPGGFCTPGFATSCAVRPRPGPLELLRAGGFCPAPVEVGDGFGTSEPLPPPFVFCCCGAPRAVGRD